MGSLKRITNQSDFSVSFCKMEWPLTDYGTVEANRVLNVNSWFPWVDNQGDFVKKVMIMEVISVTRFYIWESKGHHFYAESNKILEGPFNSTSRPSFYGNEYHTGQLVPGDHQDGDKEIEIRNNGKKISIKFFKI